MFEIYEYLRVLKWKFWSSKQLSLYKSIVNFCWF